MYSVPRVCIAAASGGGGKTLVSLGLLKIWSDLGLACYPFKKGPDYIDAAWLGVAASRPTINLDPFFLSMQALKKHFLANLPLEDSQAPFIALLEGNRGIYDGLDQNGACSTARLARILKCPIVICINATKATRTIAAMLQGLLTFEKGLDFKGVILNNVGSSRHEAACRSAIESSLGLPVLGAIPRLAENPLPERHMGLASHGPGLNAHIANILENIALLIKQNVDAERIVQIAKSAAPMAAPLKPVPKPVNTADFPKIGYVCDKALWFYYPENLKALNDAGSIVQPLSLLDNNTENMASWENLHGLYLGGGFPEDYLKEISSSPFLKIIASAVNNGMPIYAECGGLMVLCEHIFKDNRQWPMASIFPGEIVFTPRPQGLGYVKAKVKAPNPFYPTDLEICGHEFHYSHCLTKGNQPIALLLERGAGLNKKGEDGLIYKNVWGSYMHIFAPAYPCWARNFIKAARKYKKALEKGKMCQEIRLA